MHHEMKKVMTQEMKMFGIEIGYKAASITIKSNRLRVCLGDIRCKLIEEGIVDADKRSC